MDKEEFEQEQSIIKNINRLSNYINDVYIQTEDDKFQFFQTYYNLFQMQLKFIYKKWFPNAKTCSDIEIINRIFIYELEPKDLKIWVKYSLACLIKTCERVYSNAIDYKEKNQSLQLLQEMALLKEIAFETAIFIEDGFKIIEGKELNFGRFKRFSLYARETHGASEQILRKVIIPKSHGEFVFGPTSIFLLRQSIELWLKGIFGIQYISSASKKAIKLPPEILFNLIDSVGKKVKLPIPKSVIVKIHSWSQPYIHAGWLIHIWEIEHAQHVLRPIFYPSNVLINRNHFDNIENQLKKLLREESLIIHRMKNPESNLFD